MAAKTVLITGSSRGISLKFVEEYIKLGWNVVAAVRSPAKAEQVSKTHKAAISYPPRYACEKITHAVHTRWQYWDA
ncbi:Short chain dehydrogenase, partial [Globisporangium splendens]